MKVFQIVVFLIGIILASTQTMRHVYVKWIQPQGSVLSQFDSPLESKISRAVTLEELVPLYSDVRANLEEQESLELNNPRPSQRLRDLRAEERDLEHEIQRRERDQRDLFAVYFFWGAGLLAVVIGLVAFARVNRWLGMAGVVTGVSEMIWWTCPLTQFGGVEFEILLNSRLILSAITLICLIGLWLMRERGFVLNGMDGEQNENARTGRKA